MVGYFEDGANLVTMAMNGWAEAEPAWWLNLQAQPRATVELAGEERTVTGQALGLLLSLSFERIPDEEASR